MNQNEFQFNGKTYVAIENNGGSTCMGCAFSRLDCYNIKSIPPCLSQIREDGSCVHFVEKGKEKYRHLLKIRKEFADAKIAGLKSWEIRSTADRTFHVGDIVVYKVLDDDTHPLNGKEHVITFIYEGDIGLAENYCIFTDKERNESKD